MWIHYISGMIIIYASTNTTCMWWYLITEPSAVFLILRWQLRNWKDRWSPSTIGLVLPVGELNSCKVNYVEMSNCLFYWNLFCWIFTMFIGCRNLLTNISLNLFVSFHYGFWVIIFVVRQSELLFLKKSHFNDILLF